MLWKLQLNKLKKNFKLVICITMLLSSKTEAQGAIHSNSLQIPPKHVS